jgi:hypothetical protein
MPQEIDVGNSLKDGSTSDRGDTSSVTMLIDSKDSVYRLFKAEFFTWKFYTIHEG